MIDTATGLVAYAAMATARRLWPRWQALAEAEPVWNRFARYAALAAGVRSTAIGALLVALTAPLGDGPVAALAAALWLSPHPDGAPLDLLLGAVLWLAGRRPDWALDGLRRAAFGAFALLRFPLPNGQRRLLLLVLFLPREF